MVVGVVVVAGATIHAMGEAAKPEWQRQGLSRCPTRKECQTATKLLSGAEGYANKYGKKLTSNQRTRLRDLVRRGAVTLGDAGWVRSEFPSIFGNRSLNDIRKICKDAFGGKW